MLKTRLEKPTVVSPCCQLCARRSKCAVLSSYSYFEQLVALLQQALELSAQERPVRDGGADHVGDRGRLALCALLGVANFHRLLRQLPVCVVLVAGLVVLDVLGMAMKYKGSTSPLEVIHVVETTSAPK